MKVSPAARAMTLAALLLLSNTSEAEEVNTRFRGLTLLGNLELAEAKGLESGVTVIVHGLLAHNGMEVIAALQSNLKARGVSTLAVNLSLGVDRRTGFFDCGRLHAHRPFDSLDEIDAWIGWLKNNGATDIALIGHSQGGNHVAVYAAERNDPAVSAVVLLAPGTFDRERAAERYKQRYGADLDEVLARAEALVRAGQGFERLAGIGFLSCENATATAGSVAAWYRADPRRHTPNILPQIKARTLVVIAGADEVVPDLAPAVAPLAREAGRGAGEIRLHTVDGADHFFRDLFVEDAAEMIAEWLKG
jgi:pimeloyl-ACP methyl ester carboxylesterase